MAKPRSTKLRALTVSGSEPEEVPSRARPHKPPAKVLSARKAAALKSGGGRLPPRMREELDRAPVPRRAHPVKPPKGTPTNTRAGKREPRAGRHEGEKEAREAPRR